MEVAVTAVLGAGIRAVLARSFSRTYYRNAVNNGLLPVICDTSRIREGDWLRIESGAVLEVYNETTGETIAAEPLPEIMLDIIGAGGLVAYVRSGTGLLQSRARQQALFSCCAWPLYRCSSFRPPCPW